LNGGWPTSKRATRWKHQWYISTQIVVAQIKDLELIQGWKESSRKSSWKWIMGEIGNQIRVTLWFWLQEIPSQLQQSMEDQFNGGEDVLKGKEKRDFLSIWLHAWFTEIIPKKNKVKIKRKWWAIKCFMVLVWSPISEEEREKLSTPSLQLRFGSTHITFPHKNLFFLVRILHKSSMVSLVNSSQLIDVFSQ